MDRLRANQCNKGKGRQTHDRKIQEEIEMERKRERHRERGRERKRGEGVRETSLKNKVTILLRQRDSFQYRKNPRVNFKDSIDKQCYFFLR